MMNIDGRENAGASRLAIVAALRKPRDFVSRFRREDDGVMTYFGFMMLFMMLLVGGIGVDLMQNEMERVRLQSTADRAVLAAADLDQELEPDAVVEDYFEKAGLKEFLSDVSVDEGLNYRNVTAVASTTSKTRFMKFMGVDTLPVPATASAREEVANVEISLVLDISGSMSNNNKMKNMRDAAGVFVDTVLKPEHEDLISINLVPYTAQVNAGPVIMDTMNVNQRHNYSHCVDFEEDDFNKPTLNYVTLYEQMQHFESGWDWSYPIGNPGCPQQEYERISAFSQSPALLKARVDQYTPRANTSIHIGMKWGVAMLDPSFRPATQALGLQSMIDPAFANRPVAYDDPDTLKTILLMTDGENVDTYRIQSKYYDHPSEYAHWAHYPLFWFLSSYVPGNWGEWYYRKYSATQADTMLGNICKAARDKGIVVWSVGFEVTDHSADVMEDCASSPSHFFRVEGVEISEAFEAIAKQINQLRLTQ